MSIDQMVVNALTSVSYHNAIAPAVQGGQTPCWLLSYHMGDGSMYSKVMTVPHIVLPSVYQFYDAFKSGKLPELFSSLNAKFRSSLVDLFVGTYEELGSDLRREGVPPYGVYLLSKWVQAMSAGSEFEWRRLGVSTMHLQHRLGAADYIHLSELKRYEDILKNHYLVSGEVSPQHKAMVIVARLNRMIDDADMVQVIMQECFSEQIRIVDFLQVHKAVLDCQTRSFFPE